MAKRSTKSRAKTAPDIPLPSMQVDASAWPANSRDTWPIARLLPYANNARTHSADQVAQIALAIAKWGWTSPVLVDESGLILAGHGRVMAAKRLGLTDIPVMVARGWSEADKRAYILADNKIAENAGWDKELLAIELQALRDMPDPSLFKLVPFSQAELDRLLDDPEREGHGDADSAPERGQGAPVSRMGDLWQLGDHRLICGDSTDAVTVGAVLGGQHPHLMVTDPPYGVDYDPAWRVNTDSLAIQGHNSKICAGGAKALGLVQNDTRIDWTAAWKLFSGDVAYVWHASFFIAEVQSSLESAGFEIRSHIIWAKSSFAISRGHYHWQHEPCWYAARRGSNGHWAGDRSQTTLWQIAHRENDTGHGTQKPVECMKRPILNNSRPGDFIYEPFSGSGTTIIAAEITMRRCLAIEIDPAYVDMAVIRWQRHAAKHAVHAVTGRTFEQSARDRAAESVAA